jgi:hypothetical protein
MSSDNSSFFSNGYPSDNLTFSGDIYKVSLAPKYPLGFRVGRADGNVYRYGQFGTGVKASYLVGPNFYAVAGSLPAAATGTYGTGIAGQVEYPGTAGSRFIVFTVASLGNAGVGVTVVKNMFAGGYVVFTIGAGSDTGNCYRIKGNTASGSPASGLAMLELYEPLQTAVDAVTTMDIIPSMYSDLTVFTSAAEYNIAPVGVTVSKTVTTTYPFAFVQTWGVCGALTDAVAIVSGGEWLQPSQLTAGAVRAVYGTSVGASVSGSAWFSQPVIGYALKVNTASSTTAMYLTIAR